MRSGLFFSSQDGSNKEDEKDDAREDETSFWSFWRKIWQSWQRLLVDDLQQYILVFWFYTVVVLFLKLGERELCFNHVLVDRFRGLYFLLGETKVQKLGGRYICVRWFWKFVTFSHDFDLHKFVSARSCASKQTDTELKTIINHILDFWDYCRSQDILSHPFCVPHWSWPWGS